MSSKRAQQPKDDAEAASLQTDTDTVATPVPNVTGAAALNSYVKAYQKRLGVTIVADTAADFNPSVAHQLGIEVIPFHYVGPDGEHADDMWQSRTPHEFYEYMRKNPEARFRTMAVTPGTYMEVFERLFEERHQPIIYLGLTGGLSSSIDAAEQGAQLVRDEHPDAEIYVIDNLCPSAAAELLAIEVVRQAANGLAAEELVAWAKDARYFIQGYFTLDSLHWLAAGGRIPPTAAQVGGKLDVKPELSYDLNGSLTLKGMCRGRKKALRAILQEFKDNYANDTSLHIGIMDADAPKDAEWLEKEIRKMDGCEDLTVIRSSISPVIGSHVGPGMAALVFWGSDRREKLSLTDRIARKVRSR